METPKKRRGRPLLVACAGIVSLVGCSSVGPVGNLRGSPPCVDGGRPCEVGYHCENTFECVPNMNDGGLPDGGDGG